MIKRGMVFCFLSLALIGCNSKQDEAYKELLAVHKVNRNPQALASSAKADCHRHVKDLLAQKETHPLSFSVYKDFVPMEKTTKAYMKRLTKEETPQTVFYMTEYLGEDFAGNGVARRFVCNVRYDGSRFVVDGVGSDHGFAERTQLPIDPPAAWY